MKRLVQTVALAGWLAAMTGIAHADPLETIASRLAKGAAAAHVHKIAVLAFTYRDGALSSGSTLIAEGLTTRLVGRPGLQVIERSQIDQLLSESRLSLSGVVVSSASQKLGQVLGVDAIVTGRLVDLNNGRTSIDARLISTDNGTVLSAASSQIKRTWYDLPHLPSSTSGSAYTPDSN
jgi:TolB-like protein